MRAWGPTPRASATDGRRPIVDYAGLLAWSRRLPKRLVAAEDGIELDWVAGREEGLGRPLWSVVLSAVGVLTSKDYGLLTRCTGEDCGLLFVARNAGVPRKRCDMKVCGSRAKSSRRYHGKVKEYRQEIRRESKEAVLKRAEERAERARRATGRS